MDIYAAAVATSVRNLPSGRYDVREYYPRKASIGGVGMTRMRIARYIEYPIYSVPQAGNINHIVDQGYAHLLYALDGKRTVVTVHDMTLMVRFKRGISGVPPASKPHLHVFSCNALKRAAHIIAVSANTKQDLIDLCGFPSSLITVVHNGLDPLFRMYSFDERLRARQRFGFEAGNYILVTGATEYKNNVGALRAFSELRAKFNSPCYLVKTGALTSEWERTVKELGLGCHIKSVGIVSRVALVDLYNSVDCLLFPSFYEGFGWPPLEAMACGTPVVTSNVASLPEVVGDAGIMVSPLDIQGLASAVHDVLTDAPLRESLVKKGLARVQKFSWDCAAKSIDRVYSQVLATL